LNPLFAELGWRGAYSMCRILLVDDHITSREVTAAFLENEGHICTGVANGQEALDWLSAQTELPCIILLDLCMPVMNGWDFLLRFAWRSIGKAYRSSWCREASSKMVIQRLLRMPFGPSRYKQR
jgi:DNA-binding NarL/FixJ family response regulator